MTVMGWLLDRLASQSLTRQPDEAGACCINIVKLSNMAAWNTAFGCPGLKLAIEKLGPIMTLEAMQDFLKKAKQVLESRLVTLR